MVQNKKGTWPQALKGFFSPILIILILRWGVVEPFVIPSGSMIPQLLIHDHILVKKFTYGLKIPFFDSWLVRWSAPERGQVIVFKFPENPDVYYIKRLIAVPGDIVKVKDGRISVNEQEWKVIPTSSLETDASNFEKNFDYFKELTPGHEHLIRFLKNREAPSEEIVYKLAPHQFFFMGDNRDQSSDGRVWGFVDEELLVGQAWIVWLSCKDTLPSAPFVCDPSLLRWQRFFTTVH